MNIRPAHADDLQACQEVWESATLQPGTRAASAPAALNSLWAHELSTGRLLVAESAAGRVVGFGGSVVRSGRWFLADLFVDPSLQGVGIGSALLTRLLAGAPPHRVTMASADILAQVLYIRAGMGPRWPAYTLVGDVAGRQLRPPWLRSEPVDRAGDDAALAACDRRLSGVDRPEDLAWWCGPVGGVALWLVDESGAKRGYAVVSEKNAAVLAVELREVPTLITAQVDRPEFALDAVSAAIGWIAARGHERVRLMVPGPHPALAELLAARFRIVDTDVFCASDETLFDGRRGIPSNTLL